MKIKNNVDDTRTKFGILLSHVVILENIYVCTNVSSFDGQANNLSPYTVILIILLAGFGLRMYVFYFSLPFFMVCGHISQSLVEHRLWNVFETV